MEYRTSDIWIATTLAVCGIQIIKTEKDSEGNKVIFTLASGNHDIEAMVQKYQQQMLDVDAKTLVEKFKDVKRSMFTTLNTF